jgi:aryl-alcohol dehydrogenase-like predicted oxidoreductase
VLDAYAAAGGNWIDSADVYSSWVPGNRGGESEEIIGRWMAARGNRDRMVIGTKVGQLADRPGVSAENIREACADSLRRLQTDYIDVYYAHRDLPDTAALEETLGAFDELVREGKVRHIAASNYTAERLAEALDISEREGLARYVVLQPPYNLVQRDRYEGALQQLCVDRDIAVAPYSGLASGFLTGKYRPGAEVESARSQGAAKFLEDERGPAVLEALDAIAAERGTTQAAAALAWVKQQPGVVTPIASARTPEQLADLLPAAELELTPAELERLSSAGS